VPKGTFRRVEGSWKRKHLENEGDGLMVRKIVFKRRGVIKKNKEGTTKEK